MDITERIYHKEYKCAGLPGQDERNRRALDIIANMHPIGTSFTWATMRSIARYALTGEDDGGEFGVTDKQKAVIDGSNS